MRLIERGHAVAVLAGTPRVHAHAVQSWAIRTRMPQLAVHPDAFVRPSPAGNGLGGITGSTAAAVSVCEAAGYDNRDRLKRLVLGKARPLSPT